MKNIYYVVETDCYDEVADVMVQFTNKQKAIQYVKRLAAMQLAGNKLNHTHYNLHYHVTTSKNFIGENRKVVNDIVTTEW